MADVPNRAFFASHSREFEENRYVYPVVSRRSKGISVGINLSPDMACNFSCVYCQVESALSASRPRDPSSIQIDLARLAEELDQTVEAFVSGTLFERDQFHTVPEKLRRLNDFAFSGNGEPTLCPQFAEAVEVAAEVRRGRDLEETKLVLITNATRLQDPQVIRGLELLDCNHGEIWAKLDAGTQAAYQKVSRSRVPFRQILDNLVVTAQKRPIVVQTLFMRMNDRPTPEAEVESYCRRLLEILESGGQIHLIQIHTVARLPAESWITALSDDELDRIGQNVRDRVGRPVEIFYGG